MKNKIIISLFIFLIANTIWAQETKLMEFTTNENVSVSFNLTGSAANTPVQIDWGNGLDTKEVGISGTTVSGVSGGLVTVYADASSVVGVTFSGSNTNYRTVDFSKASGLKSISFTNSNNNNITSIHLPEETGNLQTLNLSYCNKITEIDLSSYLNLTNFTTRNNGSLLSLTLPGEGNQLREFTGNYMNNGVLERIDFSNCNQLTKLLLRGCASLEELILPSVGEALTSLELIEDNLKGVLDVSSYLNLRAFDCTFNEITRVILPSETPSGFYADIHTNLITLNDLPEGSFSCDYSPQKTKYVLSDDYTTLDWIDLSEWYVLKKGVSYYYTEEGVYPTFSWYLDKSTPELLVADEDYEIVDGCKFRFKEVPSDAVYCVISSAGYPSFSGGEALKTNSINIQEGIEYDELISFTTVENVTVSFSLAASSAGTPIQIDWGSGRESFMVNQSNTTISGTSSGSVKVYGDASSIVRATFSGSNTNFRSVDFSKASGLTGISFTNSNNNITSIVFPEDGTNLQTLDLSYTKLTELDLFSYLNLTSLTISRINTLETLVLPGESNKLREFTGNYMNNSVLRKIDLSTCNQLTKIVLRSCSGLEELILPSNGENLTSLELIEVNLEGVLDVTSYSNLSSLECTFNRLTGILLPSEPRNGFSADIHSNRILLNDLPEGPFSCDYNPQYAEYVLSDEYTTLDWIDLSAWYVPKKGTGYNFTEQGVYPTLSWYLDNSNTLLSPEEDYEVVDGCKFRFKEVPSDAVYCVISSAAYPSFSGGTALKTNSITIEKGVEYDELFSIITSENVSVSFSLYASAANTPIQVDWGNGRIPFTVNTSATSISGTSGGVVTVYGDAVSIVRAAFNNTNIRGVDLSKASGLATVSFSTSSSSTLSSLILPEEPDNLKSLDVNYSKITELDLSSYLNLTTLSINSTTALTSLTLPGEGNLLSEFTANSTAVSRIDLSNCINLTKITSRSCSNMEEFILPSSADNLTSLTLIQINLRGVLDLNRFSNLLTIDCSFNELTKVVLPTEPRSGLDVDVYSNRILLPDLPEGPFTCSYMPQYAEYILGEDYTNYDWIDLSMWYVGKRGVSYQYLSEQVYYPTFTWYVEGSNTSLVVDEDYEVVDNCKFRFKEIPSAPVYCVIYSGAYPYLEGAEGLKTNSIRIQKGVEYGNLMEFSLSTVGGQLGIKLYGSENNTPVQIDWGNGREMYTVNVTGNTLRDYSAAETVTVYADPLTIVRAEISGASINVADFSASTDLSSLKLNTSSKATSIILPEEKLNLVNLDLEYNNLSELDLSEYVNLEEISCKGNLQLTTLLLPTETSKLRVLNSSYTIELNSLNVSQYSNLEKLSLHSSEKLEEFILPENGTALKELICVEVGLTGVFDVSKYVNLVVLDCSYNEITSILLPEEPSSQLDLTCYYNNMYLSDLPEGSFSLYYTPQNVEYNLDYRYTTNELIDMSEWYVLKKGVGYYYNPNGAYPVFQWYLSGSTTPLVAGTDYTVIDGCKFRFSKAPETSVYCVISHSGYPEFKNDLALKTNELIIIYEAEPSELLVTMVSSATEKIEFIFASGEGDTEIKIELDGKTTGYLIEEDGTAVSLTSGGKIKIYGNPNRINYLDVSGIELTSLDASGALSLQELNCNNNALETLILPVGNTLKYVDCENNNLTTLDVSENNLSSLKLKNNKFTLATLPHIWLNGTYAPQADYVITTSHVSDATIDLSELYVSKMGVTDEEYLTEFVWYIVGENTPLESGKDYAVENNSKFTFLFEGTKEVYAVVSTEAYPDFTGENAYKTTSYAITPTTGISSIINDGVRVFAQDNRIVILSNEECEYSIATISGNLISKGNGIETVEFVVGERGVYIVQIRKQAETKTYKVLINSVK